MILSGGTIGGLVNGYELPGIIVILGSLLPRRELEVARLAAKGWTNTQIADQLFISVATVKRHLATILEKLNINSRRELAEGKL